MARLYNLTGNNIKGTPIVRRPDWDFEDDGNNFRCFEYRGLQISVSTYDGELFLHIAYYPLALFPWEDWRNVEEYKLCDKYNGTREGFEMTELIADCDRIADKVVEMNEAFENEIIDWQPVYGKLESEIIKTSELAEKYKSIKWWEIPEKSLDFSEYINYFRSFMRGIERAQAIKNEIIEQKISKKRLKELTYRMNTYGYVELTTNKDDFYIKCLDEIFDKYNH